ncbi:tail sheath [Edwardsiella phage PEi21]|uniref:DUF3383 family protein n=1 Tax=Edwardsiella phage PEi21 TaxID=1325372 RepID=N0DP63_9CAUD|nr:tail sheath [Edwardsiella phage PEi21]BAN16836.1 hypothetical protein [Edwardsiella phage PEi21]
MSYPASQIIPINVRISPAGLGTANFASTTLFAPQTEATSSVGFSPDTYRDYYDIKDVATDFKTTTETYKAASKWLGGTPASRQLRIYLRATTDTDWPTTLNKVANKYWWYLTFVTATVYAAKSDVQAIAEWCESANVMFINCQTGQNCTDIRDPSKSDDIASLLTTAGYRHTYTACHATDAYSGIYLAKWFAAVNYSADNSTITGEFKKSPGLAAESLTATEYNAMIAKKACFYTLIDLQGSSDVGRWKNTVTHSTYGEEIANVVDLDAMVNALTVALYNTVSNQPTKLKQTPVGQAMLIGATRNVGEQYVRNGYLGPRNYLDPDDGQEKYTAGYEILTKPEDILNLSDADRNAHKSAPIRMRLFRSGSIWVVEVDVDVF